MALHKEKTKVSTQPVTAWQINRKFFEIAGTTNSTDYTPGIIDK